MYKKNPIALYFIILLLAFLSNVGYASFNKNLWPRWQINNPLSQENISHDDWQTFLDTKIVTNDEGINLVDYAHLNQESYNLLKQYVSKMAKVNINAYNRAEQLAFWLNLYNALTVLTVADHYPVGSIEEINISPGLFSVGPWGKKMITINNTLISLDEIQNRIIRPIWNDPRTLYALNNGSIGAANLSKQAFHGFNLEAALNAAAFEYINSLRGVQVIEGALVVSKIYDWFDEDFGGTKQGVITHLKQFAKEPLLSQLKHVNDIDSHVYNWHLNTTVAEKS